MKTLRSLVAEIDVRSARAPAKQAAPFYHSGEWRALIGRLIRSRGRSCQDPAHVPGTPREGVRIYGDHIRELRDGGAALDPANVLLRCGACHNRKTAAERDRRMRG